MFDRLRGAFSDVAKSLGEKELGEKDIEDALFELEIALLESDVATEVTDSIKADLKAGLLGTKVDKKAVGEFVRESLISSISALFDGAGSVDILGRIGEKKAQGQPYLVLFVGINGTGKTTTLAKMAHMLREAKYSVVIAAADTFRAGAIEQLREHTNRLGLKLVAQNYNSDPAAVARDAVLYAKSHRTDCVLIDTAGRMQTSTNLMEQIAKITKVVNPDLKVFVGDSLAGNDTVNQAREFYEHVKFDGAILTKTDADARGGAALSIVKVTSTPVMYVGVGQEYGDLRPFDKKVFLEAVFGKEGSVPGAVPAAATPTTAQPAAVEPAAAQTADAKPAAAKPEPEPAPEAAPVPEPQPAAAPPKPDEPVHAAAQPAAATHTAAEPSPRHKDPKPAAAAPEDPFEGISDGDIAEYSDIFDVPPPESDTEAAILGAKIRKWVAGGKQDAGDSSANRNTDGDNGGGNDDTDDDNNNDNNGHDSGKGMQGEQPKRKRGRFGFLGK